MADHDVFLSYNRRDAVDVERIAERLTRWGVKPFLDRWSHAGGDDWQREIGAALDSAAAFAVFFGPYNIGVWASQELGVALVRDAQDADFRVIPVLLPGVPEP